MNCPECNSSIKVKAGKVENKQRYKCKECGCNYYSVEIKPTVKPKPQKRQALHLYLEGLDSHSIGKILGVSDESVSKWIKEFGQKIQELRPENQQVEMVEVNKLHSYVGSKKNNAGYKLLLIDTTKDAPISLLATKGTKQQKNAGKK